MPSRQGFKVWELLVATLVIGGGFVLFIRAAERVREKGYAVVPTAHMQDIVSACNRYHEQHQKWPTAVRDLKPYMTRPDTYESLVEGWYTVVWSSLDKARTAEDDTAILVYQRYVLSNGGFVCYRDGRVELVTAEEAKAALAAGTK